jgi:hypothetical protein
MQMEGSYEYRIISPSISREGRPSLPARREDPQSGNPSLGFAASLGHHDNLFKQFPLSATAAERASRWKEK